MKTKRKSAGHESRCDIRDGGGWTLLEILAVVGLLSIALVMTAPSISGTYRSYELNESGAMLLDHFQIARQHATTQNTTIYVDLGMEMGEWRRLSVSRNLDGAMVPVENPIRLPDGITVVKDEAWSSILARPEAALSLGDEQTVTRRIAFHPSGRTDLPPGGRWHLTIHTGPGDQLPDSNFITLVISPLTGRIYSIQP